MKKCLMINGILTLVIVILSISCGVKPDANGLDQYRRKAGEYYARGEYDKAVAEYYKLLKADEKDTRTYWQIADCFEKLGEADSAITYYEGAIVYNARDIAAYERIADVYYQLGDNHESMAWYDRALQIGYISSDSYVRLANIHQGWGENAYAEKYYKLALAGDSLSAEAYYGLGAIDLMLGDTLLATVNIQKAFDIGQSSVAAFWLGRIAANSSDYNKAIKMFDKCIELEGKTKLAEQAYQLKMQLAAKLKMNEK